jgi:hypothetical protein
MILRTNVRPRPEEHRNCNRPLRIYRCNESAPIAVAMRLEGRKHTPRLDGRPAGSEPAAILRPSTSSGRAPSPPCRPSAPVRGALLRMRAEIAADAQFRRFFFVITGKLNSCPASQRNPGAAVRISTPSRISLRSIRATRESFTASTGGQPPRRRPLTKNRPATAAAQARS